MEGVISFGFEQINIAVRYLNNFKDVESSNNKHEYLLIYEPGHLFLW